MAETVREKTVCSSCGARVRDGAVFCYNCGASVSAEKKAAGPAPARTATNNGRPADDVGSPKTETLKIAESQVGSGKPIETNTGGESSSDLRSAASMRSKVKAYNRKPVEVVWAEPERPPAAYIIASILLIVFTVVMLFLAWLLK